MSIKKQQEIRKNISKLNSAITKAIDEVCTDNGYNISYAEINIALTDVIRSNLGYELKEMWKNK